MNNFEIATLVICTVLLVRNTVALVIGLKHSNFVYKYNVAAIKNDWQNYPNNMLEYEHPIFSHCYYMLDMRKWTFKQFHPNGVSK